MGSPKTLGTLYLNNPHPATIKLVGYAVSMKPVPFVAPPMSPEIVPVQRWAVLAGSSRRSAAEEAELQALIEQLQAAGRVLAPPCRRR